jgi:hypothetical protein
MQSIKNLFGAKQPAAPVPAPRAKPVANEPLKMIAFGVIGVVLVFAVYKLLVPSPVVVIQGAPVTAPPLRRAMAAQPMTSKPVSTPTTLGSKYGLGGGPLVGSQSIRLGGSAFLPGRQVTVTDNRFRERSPSQMVRPTPPPEPEPIVVVPASAPDPPPRKRKRFLFFGAPATPYETRNNMIVDTRDGQIIQPRL